MKQGSSLFATLLVVSGYALCIGCKVSGKELILPCGVKGLRWNMSEAELKRARPRAVWNDSTEAYHEHLDGCLPFVTDAGYKFTRRGFSVRKSLESISLGRDLHDTTPEEVSGVIPGFVMGAVSMWGQPNGVELFTRPKFENREYWNVGLWWKSDWGQVYIYWNSPLALPKSGAKHWADFTVYVTRDGVDEFRVWNAGVSDPGLVARHFAGIPASDATHGAVLQ